MNYPEELREKYNEVMYDERSIIEKFLKDQYDIRYGRQRDTWHFEPAIEMIAHQGSHVLLHDMKLDKGRFVVFYVEAFCDKNAEWECFDFAYGELSKVIEALPDADEIVKKNAIDDIAAELEVSGNIVWTVGKKHIIGDGFDVLMVTGNGSEAEVILRKCNVNTEPIKLKNLSTMELKQLRDHINIDVLHRSEEYKKVMELLSLEPNLRKSVDEYDKTHYGLVTFIIESTDIEFDVSAIQRDDKGNLTIFGADTGCEDELITLTEKEIRKEYLAEILRWMTNCNDIMDTRNAHNAELVRNINAAWKSGKYNQEFGYIIYSIANRDYNECKEKFDCDMDNFLSSIIDDCNESSIHNVLDNVCDDQDLETILSFIRYEE